MKHLDIVEVEVHGLGCGKGELGPHTVYSVPYMLDMGIEVKYAGVNNRDFCIQGRDGKYRALDNRAFGNIISPATENEQVCNIPLLYN